MLLMPISIKEQCWVLLDASVKKKIVSGQGSMPGLDT